MKKWKDILLWVACVVLFAVFALIFYGIWYAANN
jgi:hypothetical protein